MELTDLASPHSMCTPYICIKTSFCAVVETRDKCYLCPVILIVSPIAEKGH